MCSCFHSLAQFVRAEGHTALFRRAGHDQHRARHRAERAFFLVGLRMGITGYVLSVALADLACTLLLFVRERLWRQLVLRPGWAAARGCWPQHPHDPDDVVLVDHERADRYMSRPTSAWTPTVFTPCPTRYQRSCRSCRRHFHGGVAVSRRLGGAGAASASNIRFFSKVWCSFQSVMFLAGACIIAFGRSPCAHDRTVLRRVAVRTGARHGDGLFRVRELSRQRHGRKAQQARSSHP